MSVFSQKLATAKAAPRPHIDVVVSLNKDLSERREALILELDSAKASNDDRLTNKPASEIVQEKLDALMEAETDTLVTLRFIQLPGDAWNRITGLCPPDPDNILDRHYQYGLAAACRLAAVFQDDRHYSGVLEGDTFTALSDEEWADLFALMSGPEVGSVVDAVYGVNVFGPTERLNGLKKALASLTA